MTTAPPHSPLVAVVGTGPAGLMAATAASRLGCRVRIFEKRRATGHKLLVAGSSGLNVTHADDEGFADRYGASAGRMAPLLREFGPRQWLAFIESLGIATFQGTSRRFFVEGMKAAVLLSRWTDELKHVGVTLETGAELVDFAPVAEGVRLALSVGQPPGALTPSEESATCDAAVLALGGASWEPRETPLRWPAIFARKSLAFEPFRASNTGYDVDWPEAFLKEVEGRPLKTIALTTARGTLRGELVVTRYGLEGTPIYALGNPGPATLDLKPDLDASKVLERLAAGRENLSPLKRVKRRLGLCEAGFALVAHLGPRETLADLDALSQWIKRVPIELRRARPLEEAISSAGGLSWDELDASLMLTRAAGVFCAGEMIAWDAPTGGFLIQASVTQGWAAGKSAARYALERARASLST